MPYYKILAGPVIQDQGGPEEKEIAVGDILFLPEAVENGPSWATQLQRLSDEEAQTHLAAQAQARAEAYQQARIAEVEEAERLAKEREAGESLTPPIPGTPAAGQQEVPPPKAPPAPPIITTT